MENRNSSISMGDILTSVKNAVTAINSAAQSYLSVQGKASAAGLTSATVASSSAGRLVNVSVIVAGSATGMVYDSNSTTGTSRPIYVIPMTVGVFQVNIPVSYGVTVAPGSGQTVTVSYS